MSFVKHVARLFVAVVAATVGASHTKFLGRKDASATPDIVGYFSKTTKMGQQAVGGQLPGATDTVCFSGWSVMENAVNECEKYLPTLTGRKWISFGGGVPKTGSISADTLKALRENAATLFKDYQGVMLDLEVFVGDAATLEADITNTIAKLKENFEVSITFSHTGPKAPYNIMTSGWFTNPNVSVVVPQMYTAGTTLEFYPTGYATDCSKFPWKDWAATACKPWTTFKSATNKIAVGIPTADMYTSVEQFFGHSTLNVPLAGYFQWVSTTAN